MSFEGSNLPDAAGGAFQGRGRQYLRLLVCPVERAPLLRAPDAAICEANRQHRYPFEDGILRLADADQRAALDALSDEHEAYGQQQGWHSPDEGAFKSLPQTGLSGYPEDYWPQHAAATALLWRFLEAIRAQNGALPVGPAGEAAVLGAGMGWLAYALDVAGYTTVAVDALAGPRHGLGVYSIARYLRVQADPVRPPLAPEMFDLVLFQEGLARSRSEADEATALAHGVEVLKPRGVLVVMDAFPESLEQIEVLQARLEDAGLRVMDLPPRLSWRARIAERMDQALGRNGALPPVVVARKMA